MSKKAAAKKETGPATIQNRRARFDYEISDTFEAGLVLVGSEVKSVYNGRVNLTDAYIAVRSDEMWLLSADIEPYDKSSRFLPERRRDRKLLMHRKEIDIIERRALEKQYAVIPLKIYFKNGKAKVEIGLGKGKRQYDKREKIAERETRREIDRAKSERV